jgi:hypothetical protein
VPLHSIHHGRWLLRLIDDAVGLFHEASAMRHCVSDFAQNCMTGTTLIVSIRRTADPHRRVATARLERGDGAWRVAQVRGFANGNPGKGAERAAQFLASVLGSRSGPRASAPLVPATAAPRNEAVA